VKLGTVWVALAADLLCGMRLSMISVLVPWNCLLENSSRPNLHMVLLGTPSRRLLLW
jgi:hypothetical protein